MMGFQRVHMIWELSPSTSAMTFKGFGLTLDLDGMFLMAWYTNVGEGF